MGAGSGLGMGGDALWASDLTGELAFLAPAIPWIFGGGFSLGGWGSAGIVAGGIFVAASIPGDTPKEQPEVCDPLEKDQPAPCDPPAGTMYSEFHSDSTPHTTRDIDGNNIGRQPNHVHIFKMNRNPKGCFWNSSITTNYTPVNARPCSLYPSWVAQHGRNRK